MTGRLDELTYAVNRLFIRTLRIAAGGAIVFGTVTVWTMIGPLTDIPLGKMTLGDLFAVAAGAVT